MGVFLSKFIGFLVFLFIGMAWLSPFHMNPWLTASSEILSFLSLFALIIYFREKAIDIQKKHLFLLGISVIPFIQYFLGIVYYFETALLCFCYLFGAGWCFIYGSNVEKEDLDLIKIKIFKLVLLVASIVSLFGFVQYLGLERGIWFITPLNEKGRIYSNFSQPNNMATFLNFGLISAIYLYEKKIIRLPFYFFSVFFIVFCVVFSYSRVGFLGCFIILVVTFIYYIFNKNKKIDTCVIGLSFLIFITIVIFKDQISVLLNNFNLGLSSAYSFSDRFSSVGGRSSMWVQMLYAIRENPVFGYGWNQTAIAQLAGANFSYHYEQTRSAHNVFLDIILWNGNIIGFLIIVFIFYLSVKIILIKDNYFIKLLLFVFGMHALLEYPQNYAYFLFFISFLVGLLFVNSNDRVFFNLNKGGVLLLIFIFSIIFSFVIRDYLTYKYILVNYTKDDYEGKLIKEDLVVLDRLDTLLGWVLVDRDKINDRDIIYRYSKFVKTAPTEYNLLNIVEIHERNNLIDERNEFCNYYVNLYQKKCK